MRVSFPLLGLVALSACSPPEPNGGGADAGVFAPTAPQCVAAQRHCESLTQCGTERDRALNRALFGYSDDSQCQATLEASVDSICYEIDSSLEEGRVAVDRVKTLACKQALDALTFAGYLAAAVAPPEACRGRPFVTGLQAIGEACDFDRECAGLGVCSAAGVCAPLPRRGEACLGTRCETGLTCTAAGVCEGEVACRVSTECAESEFCDQPGNDWETMSTMPNLMGTCVAKVAQGAACDDRDACINSCPFGATRAPGCLQCAKTNGFSSDGYRNPGTCEPARAAGASCTEASECISLNCECPGLSCTQGVCR